VASQAEELRKRTETFAVQVVEACGKLPATIHGSRVSKQLGDAASSVASNYRAACRARSRAEFIAKLGTVLEEADESAFWLRIIVRTGLLPAGSVAGLQREAEELSAIFNASVRTAKGRR
jgi:four helix bundle protein